jgi:hypothetical protein
MPKDMPANTALRAYGSDEIVDMPKPAYTMSDMAKEVSNNPIARVSSPGTSIFFFISTFFVTILDTGCAMNQLSYMAK